MAWAVYALGWLSFLWLLLPVGSFVIVAILHERVATARETARQAVEHYERGLARLEDRWSGHGEDGGRYLDEAHPYAVDLDLFGRGSLFQLLSTARTRVGEDTLAAWLLAPAPPAEARARQEAVAELRGALDLREDLALIGGRVRSGLEATRLAAWGEAPPLVDLARLRLAAFALGALPFACLLAVGLGLVPASVFLVAAAVNLVVARATAGRVERMVAAGERPARDLALLAELLARLERERFRAARLAGLGGDPGGRAPASRRIAALGRLHDWLDARYNQLFAPIALLLLWAPQLALAIEAWRQENGRRLGAWLQSVGEAEALLALSAYAFEHPGDPFPELGEGEPSFVAEGLGHPLLPAAGAVANDLALGQAPRLLVVSGSNMSGKSTLLRAVGVAAVLAQAGAPVRARRLSLSPLAVGASIRTHDSLQDGTSRFYAELKRVAQLLELARGPRPALVLLDEVFAGTNSHDRRIGAEAVVRAFLERGARGLVTTHDLALAELAQALAPRVANVHFEDQIEAGRIRFDYRLRPGVVTRSNALELMRSVGIEV